MKRNGWAIVLFLASVYGVCLAQSQPQSLADVARKARSHKKAVTVLTDDNFARRSAPALDSSAANVRTATEGPAAGAPASSPAGQPKKTDSAQGNSSSNKAGDLKKQLDSYKAQEDGWNQSAKRYQDLLANETDEFRRQMYQDALSNDQKNAKYYQGKVDQTQSELSQTQENSGQRQTAAKPASSSNGRP